MKLRHTPLVAAVLLLSQIHALRAADTTPQKPNVLFIAIDDLRPELGCYGKNYIQSPNIDSLAKNGIVFNHAYVQQSVCSPSRTVVMTGVRPDTSKVWDLVTHFRTALPNVVTLGQCFQQNGYFVQGMGKIYHVSMPDPPTWSVPWVTPKADVYALPEDAALVGKEMLPAGTKPGTQVDPDGAKGDNAGAEPSSYSIPGTGNSTNPVSASAVGTGKKGKKKGGAEEGGKANIRGPIYECADVPDNTFTDGKVADLAVDALKDLAANPKHQPFFLAVGFIKPHLPWVSPKKYWDMYDPAKIDLAPNQFLPIDAPPYAIDPNDGEVRSYKGIPPSGPVPPEVQHKFKQAYFAGVSYSDAQVGKVISELKRLGLDKNTIIILWGDHGWKLGEHSAWGKHTNVENDVNAPLILSVPGMKNAGTHTDALVEFVDIYPTLCDLAGLPKPGHLEGTSFTPLLENPDLPWKSAAFSQYPRGGAKTGGRSLMGYTMRTDRYRFTVWVGRQDHTYVDAIELYDHKTDPQENYNLAKKPENAALVKELMEQWQKGWEGNKPAVSSATKSAS